MDGEGKSMKSQLKHANKINAKYVIIVGDDELARGEAIIRDMQSSEQETVALSEVVARVTSLVKDDNNGNNARIAPYPWMRYYQRRTSR